MLRITYCRDSLRVKQKEKMVIITTPYSRKKIKNIDSLALRISVCVFTFYIIYNINYYTYSVCEYLKIVWEYVKYSKFHLKLSTFPAKLFALGTYIIIYTCNTWRGVNEIILAIPLFERKNLQLYSVLYYRTVIKNRFDNNQ